MSPTSIPENSDSQRIRQLRPDVGDVIAAGGHARQNGRVRDRRAVIAPDAPREHRRDRRQHEQVIRLGFDRMARPDRQTMGDRNHERHQDRHRSPGRSGRERHRRRKHEDDRTGSQWGDSSVSASAHHEVGGVELERDRADRPREDQNDHGEEHRLESLDHSLHRVANGRIRCTTDRSTATMTPDRRPTSSASKVLALATARRPIHRGS